MRHDVQAGEDFHPSARESRWRYVKPVVEAGAGLLAGGAMWKAYGKFIEPRLEPRGGRTHDQEITLKKRDDFVKDGYLFRGQSTSTLAKDGWEIHHPHEYGSEPGRTGAPPGESGSILLDLGFPGEPLPNGGRGQLVAWDELQNKYVPWDSRRTDRSDQERPSASNLTIGSVNGTNTSAS